MCLATSQRPQECAPSLRRFFSIRMSRPSATTSARRAFLNMCPAAQGGQTSALADVLAAGAGNCDAATLNTTNTRTVYGNDDSATYVSNVLPSHCQALLASQLVVGQNVRYVGVMEQGGYWVAEADYPVAQAAWEAARPPVVGPPPIEGGA
jgi:hypothetical protein